MKPLNWTGCALAIALLSGCGKESAVVDFHGEFSELVPRLETVSTNLEFKGLDKLPGDAVMVAVNGYPLTKKVFDDVMLLRAAQVSSEKDANPVYANNQVENFKKTYLRNFVNQRLMIDRARELKLVSPDEMEKLVNEYVRKSAEALKMPVGKFVARYKDNFKYFLYEAATRIYQDRLVAKCIPPKREIDDEFLAAVKAEIQSQNKAAKATNELIRVRMAGWKKDILQGKTAFDILAKKENEDDYADEKDPGIWGTFERQMIEDVALRNAVFSLREGAISDPVEDDEGFHLFKVYQIKPPQRNEAGRIIQDEVRTVGHILKKKVPLLIEDTDAILTKELKYQMQMHAINDYLRNLMTNGSNRVVFPYGSNITL